MSFDARRMPRQHRHEIDSYDSYANHDPKPGIWARVRDGGHVLPALLVLLALAYQARSRLLRPPPLVILLWDAVVWLIPATLLDAVDGWLNPPLFPRPGSTRPRTPRTHSAKSEVLRRMLGLDEAASTASPYRPSGCKGAPAGLGNYDNSCYQNSVLQALASLGPLPAYLASTNSDQATRTTDTLRELVAELNNGNGRTLWTPAVLKNMSTWQQQDAQEYFSKLLDEVDKDVSRALLAQTRQAGLETISDQVKDDTAASQHSDDSGYQSLSAHSRAGPESVKNPLEGLTAQRVACLACGHSDGLSMIPFNCLTLNLSDRPEHDILERLDHYTRVEAIMGVECAKCTLLKFRGMLLTIIDRSRRAGHNDNDFPEPFARLSAVETALEEDDFSEHTLAHTCKVPARSRVGSTKTKQAVIARPPRCLALHLNRSVFDENTGHMFKNVAAVRFPATLDLGPWLLGSAGRDGAKDEQWLLDPAASMVAGDGRPSRLQGPIYELRAVITHYGRHENGHYVCYRRHPLPAAHGRDGREDDERTLVYESHGKEETEHDETQTGRHFGPDQGHWWRISDQDVIPVDEETVLAQGGVFMLYYDCVEPFAEWASDGTEMASAAERGEHLTAPKDDSACVLARVLETAASVPLPDDELGAMDGDGCSDSPCAMPSTLETAASVTLSADELDADEDKNDAEALDTPVGEHGPAQQDGPASVTQAILETAASIPLPPDELGSSEDDRLWDPV